MYYIHVIKYYR